MAVENPGIKIDPYQSTVPLVQIPQQDLQPGQPLPTQAGYMSKAGGAVAIGDSIVKGFMRGHEVKEKKRAEQANYSIDFAQKTEGAAWDKYQEALRTGQAKPGDKAAPQYAEYLKAHGNTTDTMAKYVLPPDKPKGSKKQKDAEKKEKQPGQGFGGRLKDFMEANPHFIPQLALASRVPKNPVMSAQTEEIQNQLKLQGQNIELGKQQIESNDIKAEDERQQKAVEEAGGYEKVIADPKADPTLQMAARAMQAGQLDKMSPEARLNYAMKQQMTTGNTKDWTPAKWNYAYSQGMALAPEKQEIEEKGQKYVIWLDPVSHKQIGGRMHVGKVAPDAIAIDAWQNAQSKARITAAVQSDPAHFGIKLTGNPQVDDANKKAVVNRYFMEAQDHIAGVSEATGRGTNDVWRDYGLIEDSVKDIDKVYAGEAKMEGVTKGDDKAGLTFNWEKWPGGAVKATRQDIDKVMNEFITSEAETPGTRTFRASVAIPMDPPDKDHPNGKPKDWKAVERDRQWAYQLMKNRLMDAKGKNAMTEAQAENYLDQTVLGNPVTPTAASAAPPKADATPKFGGPPSANSMATAMRTGKYNNLEAPPTAADVQTPQGGKYYSDGSGQVYQLSDEEAAKAKAKGISLNEVSADSINQLTQ